MAWNNSPAWSGWRRLAVIKGLTVFEEVVITIKSTALLALCFVWPTILVFTSSFFKSKGYNPILVLGCVILTWITYHLVQRQCHFVCRGSRILMARSAILNAFFLSCILFARGVDRDGGRTLFGLHRVPAPTIKRMAGMGIIAFGAMFMLSWIPSSTVRGDDEDTLDPD